MEALSIISQFPATKADKGVFVQRAVEEMLDGTKSPLNISIQLKVLEDIISEIRNNEDVKYAVMDEADKYGKSFELNGAKITKASKPTYDYSGCGDEVYNNMIKDAAKLKEMIKAREGVLKTGINPETGETFAPPKVSTTEYLKIELK